ncbi:MAG: hypothetical protein AB8B59_12370 [Maribacter sp.]
MDREAKIKISNLGLVIAIAGFVSILLNFMPFDLMIFVWIDFFGEIVGWIIRITLVAFGLFLYHKYDQPDDEDTDFDVDLDVEI